MIVVMGSGAETAHETVDCARWRAARRSAWSRSGSTGRSRSRDFAARAAARPCAHRRARPHQGAGRARRAALPRRGRRARTRRAAGGRRRFAGDAARHRRALRPSSKEFTPAMVKAVFDELAQAAAEEPLHRRHRRRRDPHCRCRTTRAFDIEAATTCARACSSAWAPTARSARTRTRSRSSARRPTTTRRATSSTTRRSRARSRSRTCASGPRPIRSPYLIRQASFVACHQFGSSSASTCSTYAAPGATFLLNSPFGARRGLGPAAARGAGADRREAAASSTSSTPTRWRATTGMGGRINTIMQTCFFAISRRAAARRGDRRRSSRRSRRPTARRGDEVVRQNFAAVDATLAHLHEVARARRRSTRRARRAADRARRRARLRAARDRA